ncbi:Beauvericin cluster-specific repressor BEA4 [Colletotrichum fructicola]|nr:Beauvericin cluster-specific repressor BEA4 [Colletotrichum fructicola]
MVYCGKPSKGCSSCRERKIRCDQKEPGCGQCEKRQQECPGYRNLVDLMFRDESAHVKRKATKTRARICGKPPTASNAPGAPEPPGLSGSAPSSSGTEPENPAPYPRTTNRATDARRKPALALAVITQPVSLIAITGRRQLAYVTTDDLVNYDFVFDIWRPASMLPSRQVDGVMASMTAVGLAGLADLTKCHQTMDWARRSYGTALRLTNDALRDPSEAVKDTTMLSILVLNTYEMLTGRSPQTVRAWQEHLNGASALAKMRGLAQFRSRAGVRMFIMLTHIALTSCIQRSLPMPPSLVELRNQLGMLSPPGDPNWRMSGPIYRVMQLRHDIKRGKLRQTEAIVDQLAKVDNEFVDIIADLPESWHYRLVNLSQSHPAVFDGFHCHVYPALGLAATWNGIRSLRMLVHETIIGELCKDLGEQPILSWPYEAKFQLAKSVDALEKLRDAILASVPQHFGVVNYNDAKPEDRGLPVTLVRARRPPVRVVPSPATSASSSPECPSADSPPRPGSFSGPTLHDPIQMEGGSRLPVHTK